MAPNTASQTSTKHTSQSSSSDEKDRRQKNANSVRRFREKKRLTETEMRHTYEKNEKRIAELEHLAEQLSAELLDGRPKQRNRDLKSSGKSRKASTGGNVAEGKQGTYSGRPSWFGDPF